MKRLLFLFLLLLGSSRPAWAQVYVGPGGTNATGTGHGTLTNPYQTIQFGISNLPAGGVLVLLANTYHLTAPLTITRPMTLQGQGRVIIDGDNTAVVVPAGTYRYLLRISGTTGVMVQGLTFQNCIDTGAKGIWIAGGATNVTIRNCTIQNIGWTSNNLAALPTPLSVSPVPSASAIKVDGDGSVALSAINILSDSVRNCAVGYGEGITLNGNIDQFVIDHNVVSRIANIGIVAAGNYTSDFPGVPAALNRARNGRISYNQVSQCMSGRAVAAGIYLDGALNCSVVGNSCTRNGIGLSVGSEMPLATGGKLCRQHRLGSNQLTGNVFGGLVLGSGDSALQPRRLVSQLDVFNNTIWGNNTGETINGITQVDGTTLPTTGSTAEGEVSLQGLDSVQFHNNIIVPRDAKPALVGRYFFGVQHFTSNYNCYFRPVGAYLFQIGCIPFNALTNRFAAASVADFNAATTLDAASIALAGNPGLANPTGNDFTLLASSALINKGDPQALTTGAFALDCGGRARVVGGRVDLGAYENQTVLATVAPAAPGHRAYPNPATGRLWLTDAPAIRQLTVRNSLGAIVRNLAWPAPTLDVANLPPGLYLLEITPLEGPSFTERVVLY